MNQLTTFRKKPILVEAFRFDNDDSTYELLQWANTIQQRADKPFVIWNNDNLWVTTLEGQMTASVGDWIVCGAVGELYPCKPDAFAATFETLK